MLRLAAEWRLIRVVPKIHKLPGERIRDRVLSHGEEQAYLAAAPELPKSETPPFVDCSRINKEFAAHSYELFVSSKSTAETAQLQALIGSAEMVSTDHLEEICETLIRDLGGPAL